MTATAKTTAHSNCSHESTRAARAACRKAAKKAAPAVEIPAIQTVTAYGVELEVKVVNVSEITDKDMIFFQSGDYAHFTPVSVGAFRPYVAIGNEIQSYENHYKITIGGSRQIVPLDKTYTIAVDPQAVKRTAAAYRRSLLAEFSN